MFNQLLYVDSVHHSVIKRLKNIEYPETEVLKAGALEWVMESDSLFQHQYKTILKLFTDDDMDELRYDTLKILGDIFVSAVQESNRKFIPIQEKYSLEYSVE